jgi:hypothetical protein
MSQGTQASALRQLVTVATLTAPAWIVIFFLKPKKA